MSIHIAPWSLRELVTNLSHQHDAPGLFTMNVNIHKNYVDYNHAAQRVMTMPNAGGNSLISEVLSAELVDRLLGVRQIMTEMEIRYAFQGPITDYVCQVDASSGAGMTGVSVTRAMAYRRRLTTKDARRILTKKIKGINFSTASVANVTLRRQILHVWVESGADARIIRRVWSQIPGHLKSNTIVLVATVNMTSVFTNTYSTHD
ncbi:hypothetical protein BX666DRAFT_1876495 [Dichotomocladium elegans]|nr:hypothetical protein BX666DRAFT_1876495 [Dichotomocladium elegans]